MTVPEDGLLDHCMCVNRQMEVTAGMESIGNSVFYIYRWARRYFGGLPNCLSSRRLLNGLIAEVFRERCLFAVDLGQPVGPVTPSNGDIAIANIFGVDFVGPIGHVGPGVTTFPVGGKRLCGCSRIAGLLVNGIEKSCTKKIGIVEPKGVDDTDVFFDLPKLGRLRTLTSTSACSRQRFSRCAHHRLQPITHFSGTITSVLCAAHKILSMLLNRAEQLWIEWADSAHVVRRRRVPIERLAGRWKDGNRSIEFRPEAVVGSRGQPGGRDERQNTTRTGECSFQRRARGTKGLTEISVVHLWNSLGIVKVRSP